ncbi:MAG: peptidylprolyl isomerase [Gammaproteobacteria bacterium]|nr:peptidylprolyl isomerase [Gammaproteobacteria bacterium]
MQIADGKVVTFHYDLKEAGGEFVESSRGDDPVAYLHGKGGVVKGLEKGLLGKGAGDSFTIAVTPEDGYGLRKEESLQRIPIKHLGLKKKEKPIRGLICSVQTDKGPRQVTIVKAGRYSVDVDTNHPLAGKSLEFAVEVIEVREATGEELSHGHAHGVGGHHH